MIRCEDFPFTDKMPISVATEIVLLRAERMKIPLRCYEITDCLFDFMKLDHPNIKIVDGEVRPTLGGVEFTGTCCCVGALEEFGYSERLGPFTLLRPIGVKDILDRRCRTFFDWKMISLPVRRRAASRLVKHIDDWLFRLNRECPRTREKVSEGLNYELNELLRFYH